ncbi:hypothetical protein I3842_15G104200 [Carya illinoinensis]|uniref:Uncharacterized protein n=1 Tax=Carya illinoinensis TaxID=32201 RepID=A0A922AF03_CARIL|nr:hypothetical protein I3842_15G104200 [Carya illinoinensis]
MCPFSLLLFLCVSCYCSVKTLTFSLVFPLLCALFWTQFLCSVLPPNVKLGTWFFLFFSLLISCSWFWVISCNFWVFSSSTRALFFSQPVRVFLGPAVNSIFSSCFFGPRRELYFQPSFS